MDNPPLPTRIRHTGHSASNTPSTRPAGTHSTLGRLPHTGIQSIDALQTGVSRLNDYVDSRSFPSTIAAVHQPTGSASTSKRVDLCKKNNDTLTQTREFTDNLRNETREQTITSSRVLPPLPPRTYKPPQTHAPPPPLLPRRVTGLETEIPPPISRRTKPTKTLPVTQQPSSHNTSSSAGACVPRSVRTPLQSAAVLIVDVSEPPRHKNNPVTPRTRKDPPVFKQPTSSSKHELTTKMDDQTGTLTNSIICSECGMCKCSSCTDDRPLPETWLCDGNCRCAAEPVVDILSCMCVVKGLYSKCDNRSEAVHPCACLSSPNCCTRWTGLALLSLCFPCLCCFLPLKAAAAATKACYNSSCCRKRGCRCDSVR